MLDIMAMRCRADFELAPAPCVLAGPFCYGLSLTIGTWETACHVVRGCDFRFASAGWANARVRVQAAESTRTEYHTWYFLATLDSAGRLSARL